MGKDDYLKSNVGIIREAFDEGTITSTLTGG